jgi:hypothetical protein
MIGSSALKKIMRTAKNVLLERKYSAVVDHSLCDAQIFQYMKTEILAKIVCSVMHEIFN